MEDHQAVLYIAAIALGIVVGVATPGTTSLRAAINPILAALLYATFLQVPAADLLRSLHDGRFVAALLAMNFVVTPIVVTALFVLLPSNDALRIGMLLVLLCPCVDYVIVFSGIAGADNQRLLAATPLLLLLQMALLPVFLTLFMGADLTDVIDVAPFLRAFLVLIVIPLVLAWLTQAWAARKSAGQQFASGAGKLMVPLMMAVLFTVVASQIPRVTDDLGYVVALIPFYITFLVVMAGAGVVFTRVFRLDISSRRAIVFSGATRNSLVVLPLALALPSGYELAAVAVVTQTLVEVLGMVVYIRVIPRLLPDGAESPPR
ncbi:arsenic resistance protein [Gordonia jinhuaensis]